MEAKHLEPEELEYELKLRKLRYSTNSISSSPLQEILEKEGKGILNRPAGFPPISDVTIEMLKCQEKVKSLQERVNIAVGEKSRDHLLCLKSRLLHVIGRIDLLGRAEPSASDALRELYKIAREELEVVEQELHNLSMTSFSLRSGDTPNKDTVSVEDVDEQTIAVVVTFEEQFSGRPTQAQPGQAPVHASSTSENASTYQSITRPLPAVSEVNIPLVTNSGAIPKTAAPYISASGVQQLLPSTGIFSYGANYQSSQASNHEFLKRNLRNPDEQTRRNLFHLEPPTSANTVTARSARTNSHWGHTDASALNSDARSSEYGLSQIQDGRSRKSSSLAPVETLSALPVPPLQEQSHLPTSMHQWVAPQPQQPSPPQQNVLPRRGVNNPVNSWQIRFDGAPRGLAVDDFLFRVETLARADGVQQSCLVYSIHQLLSGRAATWYWQFCRKYPRATWSQLCYSLRREFEDTSDFEIKKLMEGRRQKPKEAFSDFRLEIEGLALRLREPISQNELLALIRRNMHPALRKTLILHDCNNVDEMDRLCRQVEKLWTEVGETAEDQIRTRRYNIHEMGYEAERSVQNEDICNSTECNVASLRQNRSSDQNLVICWKCDDIGHTYKDCPSTSPRIFCYSCGAKNVVKPNCFRCVKGNRQAGQVGRGHLNPPGVRFTPQRLLQKVHRSTMTDE